jgi:predicted nucleic acid-binding protein
MTVFVDTSAFYAIFDRDDANHPVAKQVWVSLLAEAATLFTTNYVLVETAALLQHRLGVAAVRSFHEDVVPLLQVDWVTEEGHRAGMEAVLAAARKKLSLVDCVSFQAMRHAGVRAAFCFDAHFREQGFTTKP